MRWLKCQSPRTRTMAHTPGLFKKLMVERGVSLNATVRLVSELGGGRVKVVGITPPGKIYVEGEQKPYGVMAFEKLKEVK